MQTRSELKRFLDLWNTLPETVPRPRGGLKGMRLVHFKSRICDPQWLDDYEQAIAKIKTIPGLLGQNNRGWCITVDWILRPLSVSRVLEGQYDHWGVDRKPKSAYEGEAYGA